MKKKTVIERILAGVLSAALTFSMTPVYGFTEQLTETESSEEISTYIPEEETEEEISTLPEETTEPVVINQEYKVFPDIPEELQDVFSVDITSGDENSINMTVTVTDKADKHYELNKVQMGNNVLLEHANIRNTSYSWEGLPISKAVADENGNIPVKIEGSPYYVTEVTNDTQHGTAIIKDKTATETKENLSKFEAAPDEEQVLVLQAEESYWIDQLIIDGIPEYLHVETLERPLDKNQNHKIEVIFSPKQYLLDGTRDDEAGSIFFQREGSDEYVTSAAEGDKIIGYVSPKENHRLLSVTISGDALKEKTYSSEEMKSDGTGNYLFYLNNLSGNVQVTAEFEEEKQISLQLLSSGLNDQNYYVNSARFQITAEDESIFEQYNSYQYYLQKENGEFTEKTNIDLNTRKFTVQGENETLTVYVELKDINGQMLTLKSEPFTIILPPEVSAGIKSTEEKNQATVEGRYSFDRTVIIEVRDKLDCMPAKEEIVKNINIYRNNTEVISDEEKETMIQVDPEISKKENYDVMTIFITFSKTGYYRWEFFYENTLGQSAEISYEEGSTHITDFVIDKEAPKGEMQVEENFWINLLSTLTFGFFARSEVTVSITSEDADQPEMAYYIMQGDTKDEVKILSREDLEDLDDKWNPYTGTFPFKPEKTYFVVYARLTDSSGINTYICSDGYVVSSEQNENNKSTVQFEFNSAEKKEDKYYCKDSKIPVDIHIKRVESNVFTGIKSVEAWYKIGEVESEHRQIFSAENNEIISKKDLKDTISNIPSNYEGELEYFVHILYNNGTEQTILPQKIIVDNVTPLVTLEHYMLNDKDEKSERIFRDDIEKYKDKRRVVLTIEEHYFSKDSAEKCIHIQDGSKKLSEQFQNLTLEGYRHLSDKEKASLGWTVAEDWKVDENNKNKHILELDFLKEGTQKEGTQKEGTQPYKIEVSDYQDKAGNVSPETSTEFEIEPIKAVGSITIEEFDTFKDKVVDFLTFGKYYKDKLKVTIKEESGKKDVKIRYYLWDIRKKESPPKTKTELNKIPKDEWVECESGKPFEIKDGNIVYAWFVDESMNDEFFISSNGYIYDTTSCNVELGIDSDNPEAIAVTVGEGENKHTYYRDDIPVKLSIKDKFPYSGIKTVECWLTVENSEEKLPLINGSDKKEETIISPPYEDKTELKDKNKAYDEQSLTFTIPKDYNRSDLILHVHTEDFAGNEGDETFPIDIDCTAPEIEISYDNNKGNAFEGAYYFKEARTATIHFKERAEHFDKEQALKCISVKGVDGGYYFGSWKEEKAKAANGDDAVYSIPVTIGVNAEGAYFDGKYQLEISPYTDKARNTSGKINIREGTIAPETFTVDQTVPEGTITAVSAEGREETWNGVVYQQYFGFWSKSSIQILAEYTDVTSPIQSVEYYKSLATTALTADEIVKLQDWKPFSELSLSNNERCMVYLKILDAAGNDRYLSTNALVIDDSLPVSEIQPPDISMTVEPAEGGIYNGDVTVSVRVEDPSVNDAYSGLQSITYRVLNMGQETQSETLYTFDNTMPQYSDLLQVWEGEVTISSELNNSNDVVLEIYAQDNVMNASVETISLSIDITPPQILVSFDNNQMQNDLFRGGRTARINISERNFSKEYVNIIAKKDGVEYSPSVIWEQTEGSGNGDNTLWYADVPFSEDGTYSLSIECTDLAENKSSEINYAEGTVLPSDFSIDATIPEITVEFSDKDTNPQGNYYKGERIATITIDEKNFNKENATSGIKVTGDADGRPITTTVSEWKESGTQHTTTVAFSEDAKYHLNVGYTDEAGNAGKEFNTDFYVDNTDPELNISVNGDTTFTAYGQGETITPMIQYEDANLDDSQVSIQLTGGMNVTVSEPKITDDQISFSLTKSEESRTWTGEIKKIVKNGKVYGKTITFNDFPSDPTKDKNNSFDDIYTFSVFVKDKAGRISHSGNADKNSMTFSVNRFGSTYDITKIKPMLNQYVQNTGEVIISEINPNRLQQYAITLFKNSQEIVLQQDEDYDVEIALMKNNEEVISPEDEDYEQEIAKEEKKWHKYTYRIHPEIFEDDGAYNIELSSTDKAGNNSRNTYDGKEEKVRFFVDKTPPTAMIANLETGKTYQVDGGQMTVYMSANDNLKLSEVSVYLDDEKTAYQHWGSAELESDFSDGEFEFNVEAEPRLSSQYHQLKVICKDASGRENEPLVVNQFRILVKDNFEAYALFIVIAILSGAVLVYFMIKRNKKSNH